MLTPSITFFHGKIKVVVSPSKIDTRLPEVENLLVGLQPHASKYPGLAIVSHVEIRFYFLKRDPKQDCHCLDIQNNNSASTIQTKTILVPEIEIENQGISRFENGVFRTSEGCQNQGT